MSRKTIAVVALVIFAIAAAAFGKSGVSQVSAACTPGPLQSCVTTSATLNPGTGAAPNIECKWELPDSDINTTGFQYGSTVATADDSTVAPATVPCDLSTTVNSCFNVVAPTSSTTPWHDSIQVNAISHNLNNATIPERDVQLWAAVDDCATLANVSDVYWDVYEPCPLSVTTGPACANDSVTGKPLSKKVQVHYLSTGVVEQDLAADGTTRPGGTATGRGVISAGHPNSAQETCDTVSDATTGPGNGMFHAAQLTGQITAAAWTNVNSSFRALCNEGVKGLYSANIQIDKDEPCGEWKVVVSAVGTNSLTAQKANYFTVNCNVNLQTDFTTLVWGGANGIQAGNDALIIGDTTWNNPANTGGPTIGNGNNSAMGVIINFSPMVCSTGLCAGKQITQFDAKFGRDSGHLNVFPHGTDPLIAAGADTYLSQTANFGTLTPASTGPAYVLCANELGKLDLSLHPFESAANGGGALPQGSYTGTVTLTGYAATQGTTPEPNICYGDYHLIAQ